MLKLKQKFNLKTLYVTLSVAVIFLTFLACKFLDNNFKPINTTEASKINAENKSIVSLESEPEVAAATTLFDNNNNAQVLLLASSGKKNIPLTFLTATKSKTVTTSSAYTIEGNCDPKEKLYLNGKSVKLDKKGNFSLKVKLKVGDNKLTFKYKGKNTVKTITYKYIVIKSVSPTSNKTYPGNTKLVVKVVARKGSKVTAKLNGTTITCKQQTSDDSFVTFKGTFTLPKSAKTNKNLGSVTFTATHNGVKETKKSGTVTVKKQVVVKKSDPSVTPKGGNYINVGSGLIATVVADYAETFNGKTTDDYSHPANAYLPKGTQDYCSQTLVKNSGNSYYKLRSGQRIYSISNPGKYYEKTVATTSVGELPDHNELKVKTFKTDKKYTTLTLSTLWKAPFEFEYSKQSYRKTKTGYTIDKTTFTYIDITFSYATKFSNTGTIKVPKNHPLFKKAEIIKNKSDYTLRLYLKKTGAFYGWDAYYDTNGNLVFRFLNPAKMQNKNSLKGITVYIDVGHGGIDPGALAKYSPKLNEDSCNLKLSLALKKELQKLGATVISNRASNSKGYTPQERMQNLRNSKANYCIAIHHDANNKSSYNGFMTAYFTPFSKSAANYIYSETKKTGLYKKYWDVEAHYYYVSRVTSCPSVLTENGFITNKSDYKNMTTQKSIDKKAKALANGVLKYFRSIQ